MKVIVLNKAKFDALMKSHGVTPDNVEEKFPAYFFVSINDTDMDRSRLYFPDDKKNVKVLFFDDVEADMDIPLLGNRDGFKAKAFTQEQAEELFSFIKHQNNKGTFCFVHCAAGISRSGAVGEFINDFFGGDYDNFKLNNPRVQPNNLVKRLLLNLWRNSR